MRILISGSAYRPALNGQSIFMSELAEGLARRDHEVVVVIPGDGGRGRDEILNGVRVVRTPALSLSLFHTTLLWPVHYLRRIHDQLNRFRPQLVHVHDSSPLCQAVVGAARRRGIPVFATHHIGPNLGAPYISIQNPLLHSVFDFFAWGFILSHLRRADRVLVPSRYSVRMLQDKGLKGDVRRVPGAVELDEFFVDARLDRQALRSRFGLDPQRTLILYVGRLDVEKRLEGLVEAMQRLQEEGVQLALVGKGARERRLRRLAERLGADGSVRFLGQVSHADLPALLNSADIFTMPSDAESFSIAVLEAMACGLPILASDSTALPELVSHGETGYLFRPGDVEDLARGARWLLERRPEWGLMAQRNALRAGEYSIERSLEMHEALYREAIGESRAT